MTIDLQHVRALILSEPEIVLHDREIMRMLVAASDSEQGTNVVDLRGVAINRLEHRLSALEDTHNAVLAAAYDNVASTNQIHRAVLIALEAGDWKSFVEISDAEFREVLNVAEVRICLETDRFLNGSIVNPKVARLEPGGIDDYVSRGSMTQPRSVTLRRVHEADPAVYGDLETEIHSEAVIRVDTGRKGTGAMIVLGSADPNQFVPSLKPDLLRFLGHVLGRMFEKWLNV